MKKTILLAGLFLFTSLLMSDWDPGDGYKMHYPQLPDPDGWDVEVLCDYISLADDWQCSATGPVDDIHLWISWEQDYVDAISLVSLAIYSDMPAPGQYGYSQPDEYLWGENFWDGDFTIRGPYYGDQGWFDPVENYAVRPDHQQYYQINIENISNPFTQISGTIYWLNVCINPIGVGWKTSQNNWNDTAVFWNNSLSRWSQLIVPAPYNEYLDLAFVIGGDTPTPVELSSFNAVYHNGISTVNWTSQSESNNQGWNIFRSESSNLDKSFRINNSMIPGAGTTGIPTEYNFDDEYQLELNSTYYYWLESLDMANFSNLYGPISLIISNDNEENPDPPDTNIGILKLCNYPNPFNSNTEISFILKDEGPVELNVYNIKGQKIASLYNGYISENDLNKSIKVNWNGKDQSGMEMISGIYFYEIKTANGDFTNKMILLK